MSVLPTKAVLETAIHQYLGATYPSAASAFKPAALDVAGAKAYYNGKTLAEYYGCSAPKKAAVDSDSDDEPAKKPAVAVAKKVSPKLAPKKAAVDSDSDDEPVKKPAVAVAKKVSPKTSPKLVPAKSARPIPDSDSDDDIFDAAPTTQAKKAAPSSSLSFSGARRPIPDFDFDEDDEANTRTAAKRSRSASVEKKKKKANKDKAAADSDDEEEPKKKKEKKEKKEKKDKKEKKKVVHSDSDVEEGKPKLSAAEVFAAYKKKKEEEEAKKAAEGEKEEKSTIAWSHTPGTRFQRIDTSKVSFVHDALKDNSAIDLAANFRQNQEMMRVRGKEFNKHKQKNKAKLYAAGVEMAVKSYKFDNDSD